MSTSTQKHRDFVGEPMGDKPVTSLSGIGGILGEKLRHQSLRQGETPGPFLTRDLLAYVVLGQFLLLKKDPEMFTEWLRDTSGANSRQAGLCSQCLREWCDAFL
uniref:Barrier to autointegration factor 1 n=1 Tax=Gasterosteus aculeatus aculeatus TaxID=481459 RepID=A0AAQ4RHD6_GASAC